MPVGCPRCEAVSPTPTHSVSKDEVAHATVRPFGAEIPVHRMFWGDTLENDGRRPPVFILKGCQPFAGG